MIHMLVAFAVKVIAAVGVMFEDSLDSMTSSQKIVSYLLHL